MDKRRYMLDEWIKILKGKWKGDYTHLAIYDYGKAANWRYDECQCLPDQCFSKFEFDARLAEIEKENDMKESTLVPREEMSDLDWLARNVHEWPTVTPKIYPAGCKEFTNGAIFHDEYMILDHDIEITKGQWLTRRAELQNKPSWDGARKWANWLGQDEDGAWWYFSAKPKCQSRSFDEMGSGICADFAGAGEVLGDWRDTLEKRPETNEMPVNSNQPKPSNDVPECAEVKQSEPFVSVEDAKISILQSDGDIKHFGGFIGRTLPFEEDSATAKQHDPVNSPSHYASGGIECIEAIKASMSHEAFLGYLKGNVQKYMWRYEKKVNPEEDLKKAKWYLSKLIEEQK